MTAASGGQTSLFALDVTSGETRTIVGNGTVSSPAPSGDAIYFLWDDLATPPEIHSVSFDGSSLQRISSFHEKRLGELRFGDFEAFTFQGWNDEAVSGYVVKPVGVDETSTRHYPVVLLIHGGPQSSFGNHFQGVTSPRIWAGAGLVNWIAGQAPERFRCFVSHAGRLDERTAYLSTDELWFPEWDHEGTLWGNSDGYETHNPIDHIEQWRTPMLVVHGGRDYRVALAQSVATFTALQRRGIESRFLYFPDEGHSVSRPQNVAQWHEVVLQWFERFLD